MNCFTSAALKLGGALALALIASGAQSQTIVNVDARNQAGTTLFLAAGDYELRIAGIGDGGAFDAYNAWGFVAGCDGAGENCSNGFLTRLSIDLGNASGLFDRTNGFDFIPAQDRIFATAAQGLAAFRASPQFQRAFVTQNLTALPDRVARFTLTAPRNVNFFIDDTAYVDNTQGVSASLAVRAVNAVPEPGTWATMLIGFGAVGSVMRRRGRTLAVEQQA